MKDGAPPAMADFHLPPQALSRQRFRPQTEAEASRRPRTWEAVPEVLVLEEHLAAAAAPVGAVVPEEAEEAEDGAAQVIRPALEATATQAQAAVAAVPEVVAEGEPAIRGPMATPLSPIQARPRSTTRQM